MEYRFFSSLLIRTPLHNYTSYKSINYSQLLACAEFKLALFLASKTFYEALAKKDFDFEVLSEKQKHTVKKYANRAAFRSTPFGLFSACSVVPWTGKTASGIVLSSDVNPYVTLDFAILARLWEQLVKEQKRDSFQYQTNPSLYDSPSDVRYYKTETGSCDQIQFSMVAIAKNRLLKKVFQYCTTGKNVQQIILLLNELGLEKDEARDFLQEMVHQQILVSKQSPNITGADYSHRLFKELASSYPAATAYQSCTKQMGRGKEGQLDSLTEASRQLSAWSGLGKDTNPFYCVSGRNHIKGGLSATYQQSIMDGLYCLSRLSPTPAFPELEAFKKSFSTKYGTREVALLQVLDEQYGIGYGNFAYTKSTYSFLDAGLKESKTDNKHHTDTAEGLAFQLINEWYSSKGRKTKKEIQITEEHLQKITGNEKDGRMPPSISVMFRVLEDQIVLEQAGGCSALSLLGRFSLSKDIRELGHNIALLEQQYNPDVVFAEIAHVSDLHTANINRRHHLRDYEIPVLTSSTIEPEKQIPLNDLMVSVINDSVVLRSRKLQKEIIPRLSSAYNYTKSCFPIFRFLCDLQYQHLKPSFSFSLPALFPGHRFYPRITYKSCVLQLAEWHLQATELAFMHNQDLNESHAYFQGFAKANGLPRHIAYTVHDNFLVFDLEDPNEVALFLKEIKNKEDVVIREFPYLKRKPLTKDSQQRPLLAQYVASLYMPETIYPKHYQFTMAKHQATDDWLYFKIYCHPLTADSLLHEQILPLIKAFTSSGILQKWFWVRYQDPDFHLRLRMKIAPEKQGTAFGSLNTLFNRLIAKSIVHHFQTDLYKQETDRYTPQLINEVETVFHASSNRTGDLLKRKGKEQWGEERLLEEAVVAVFEILHFFGFPPSSHIDFCKVQFDNFFHEFGEPKSYKPQMEILHKKKFPVIETRLQEQERKRHAGSCKMAIESLCRQFDQINNGQVTLEKLAADIIHMHMNRLFSTEQRYFEMSAYYLLYRTLTTQFHVVRRTCP